MSELLPSAQAKQIQDGLLDYLTTTFALADPDAQLALGEFLSDRSTGSSRGRSCGSGCRSGRWATSGSPA